MTTASRFMSSGDPLDYRDSELVLGVVAPVGTDLGQLSLVLKDHLKKFKYTVNEIRLSGFLKLPEIAKKHKVRMFATDEARRIKSLMDAGNKVRQLSSRPDILALYAASDIAKRRPTGTRSTATVNLLLSLKRPEEVATLRQIYGPGFFLIGVYATEAERLRHLGGQGIVPQRAEALVARDHDEVADWGQKTSSTFKLSDVFVHLDEDRLGEFKAAVKRFVDLAFGCPSETPTQEENAMFLAYAASLRSADLSRQVGAVVSSDTGEVISTGANDVPRFGGGLYWPGPDDRRDWKEGTDSNKVEIERIATEIIAELLPSASTSKLEKARETLAKTRLNDLTEFGRPVHAEMEALLHCARSGVSPVRGTMFTTTFPCHNCAKHIIAAGIRRVYFVEPYPKSKASQLHADAISIENDVPGKVAFLPFVGIAARRYFDLFSMRVSSGWPLERKTGTEAIVFDRKQARPRVPMPPTSFLEREAIATSIIRAKMR